MSVPECSSTLEGRVIALGLVQQVFQKSLWGIRLLFPCVRDSLSLAGSGSRFLYCDMPPPLSERLAGALARDGPRAPEMCNCSP